MEIVLLYKNKELSCAYEVSPKDMEDALEYVTKCRKDNIHTDWSDTELIEKFFHSEDIYYKKIEKEEIFKYGL